jgi:hypothetical protein
MANPINKLIIACVALICSASATLAENAWPEEPYYNWASRADGIALSAGDANRANIAIHTPTPWPGYLNDTDIEFNGRSAEDLMRKYYGRNAKAAAPPSTVINIGVPPAAP